MGHFRNVSHLFCDGDVVTQHCKVTEMVLLLREMTTTYFFLKCSTLNLKFLQNNTILKKFNEITDFELTALETL